MGQTVPPEPTGNDPEQDAAGRERRHATAVFADLSGSTSMSERLAPEDVFSIVAGCLRLLEAPARSHGASLIAHRGDGILAVFGLPSALEDRARAAINAAIEMRNRVHEFGRERRPEVPIDVHLGVYSGLMVFGDVSAGGDSEFDVMGDAVNVAARLCALAPAGRIYVGAETYEATRHQFGYRKLEPVRVKGRLQPVAIHEVVSERPRLHRPSAASIRVVSSDLVGREQELARLRDCAADLSSRRGGVVSLVGEAGMGKSRLLAELRAGFEPPAVSWLEARSLSIGRNLRFHPFSDLLRSWCDIRDDDAEGVARAKLETALTALLSTISNK